MSWLRKAATIAFVAGLAMLVLLAWLVISPRFAWGEATIVNATAEPIASGELVVFDQWFPLRSIAPGSSQTIRYRSWPGESEYALFVQLASGRMMWGGGGYLEAGTHDHRRLVATADGIYVGRPDSLWRPDRDLPSSDGRLHALVFEGDPTEVVVAEAGRAGTYEVYRAGGSQGFWVGWTGPRRLAIRSGPNPVYEACPSVGAALAGGLALDYQLSGPPKLGCSLGYGGRASPARGGGLEDR